MILLCSIVVVSLWSSLTDYCLAGAVCLLYDSVGFLYDALYDALCDPVCFLLATKVHEQLVNILENLKISQLDSKMPL